MPLVVGAAGAFLTDQRERLYGHGTLAIRVSVIAKLAAREEYGGVAVEFSHVLLVSEVGDLDLFRNHVLVVRFHQFAHRQGRTTKMIALFVSLFHSCIRLYEGTMT